MTTGITLVRLLSWFSHRKSGEERLDPDAGAAGKTGPVQWFINQRQVTGHKAGKEQKQGSVKRKATTNPKRARKSPGARKNREAK